MGALNSFMTEDRKYSIVWKIVHWFGDPHHEKVNP